MMARVPIRRTINRHVCRVRVVYGTSLGTTVVYEIDLVV